MLLSTHELHRFDAFELDDSARVLRRDDTPVPLTPKAFDVLAYLVMNPGRVVTKDELLKAVWPDSFVEEGNLAQHISQLRKALGDKSCLIATVPGRGYQFGTQVYTTQLETGLPAGRVPEQRPGDIFVQTVRERTHMVIENTSPAPAPLALPTAASFRRKSVIRWAGISVLATMLIALAATLAWKHFAPQTQLRKVMVADFINTTGDATFDRTLKRALEIGLEQSPYIDVMSEREALGTLGLMGRKDSAAITPDIAKEVCERSNRQVLLTGSIAAVGTEYLLTVEATDCISGKKLAGAKAEAGAKEKVLAALDSAADQVRKGLGESSKSLESYQVPIMTATTPSLDALESYSIGQYLTAQGKSETETLPFYQKAAELDPQFAMAYGAIATDYYNMGEFNLASQYIRKAFELSDRVSAKERLTIQAHYYAEGRKDMQQGISTYRQWTAIYPNDWIPWVNLANDYTQLGQYAPAIAAGERALEIEPNRPMIYSVLARAYNHANRFAEAKSTGLKAVQRGKDSTGLHSTLFEIAFAEQDADALAREIRWAATNSDSWYAWNLIYNQAKAAASAGHLKNAQELFHTSYETAQREKLPEVADDILKDEAMVEILLGSPADARTTLSHVRNLDSGSPDLGILYAQLGDASIAEKYLADHGAGTDPGTVMNYMYLPRTRAAVAMQKGRPEEAIAALEPAQPYMLANFYVLTQRAEASLQAGKPDIAIRDYSTILANRGVDPCAAQYPLAHLGLARAYALKNNMTGSRNEYEKFFTLWKDADANLPILKQARVEYSRLK
jgi:DNA-binding winged helix-turn-helix (wHTH) protein/tetratricopeptide (TPR) repeat protein